MWLSNSSIGRKVVMSVTGIALVLFLTFHMAMNLVALFSEDAYNMICEFLGANWYALVATAGLAALFVIHIIYAFWLTMQNRAARGSERYAVNVKPKTVEWASQNMLVLGIVVIAGLALHFANFWYKMQFAEIIGVHDLGAFGPTDGAAYIRETFGCPVFTVLYLIWLAGISPTDMVAAALGSCMLTLMGIAARRLEIDLKGTRVEIQKVMAAEPRRIAEIRLDFYLPGDYSDKDKKILQGAAETCPVGKSLHPDIRQAVTWHYGSAK